MSVCILLNGGTENVYSHILLQVFAGVYPVDQSEQPALRSAIEKLTLNDSSVSVHKDSR